MTKDFRCALFSGVILLGFSVNGQAALYDRGNSLIYDSDLDITWLSDANYAQTSGYDLDGRMTSSEAAIWAAQLEFAGFIDWRLPTTLQPDPSCQLLEYTGPGPKNGSFYNYFCSGSEMGHLFYNELDGIPDIPTNGATFGPNLALFTNLERDNYWSATVVNPELIFPDCTTDCVWDFDFRNGVQTGYPSGLSFFALAVHPGDIGNTAPNITSTALTNATEDELYSYSFTASDINSDNTLTLSAATLPGWLNFNSTTGILSGTPSNAEVGDHAVTLRVNDGLVDVDQNFTLTVLNVNDPPVITSTPVFDAIADVLYSYTFAASDEDLGDSLVLSAPLLPGWLSFNAGTGVLSGTPGNVDAGIHSVTLRVSDGSVDVDQNFDISVVVNNNVPVITSSAVTTATEDVAYNYTFTATDIDVGDTLTFSAPLLPSWLSFDTGTGVLSGTPTNAQVGIHFVTLRVSDGTVDVDQSFNITVDNVNDAPTISGTPMTLVAEDSAYSFTPTASDVDVDDSLSFSINNQPAWASFNSLTGQLSGTPGNADVGITSGIIITVTDSALASTSLAAFDLQVSNINDAPVITSTPLTAAQTDTFYSYIFIVNDIDVGDVLTLSAPILPAWLSFNSTSGELSGTPSATDVGSHAVTLRVNDGTLDIDQSFIIIVANDPPSITSTPLTNATQDIAYSYTFTAIDVNGDTLTLSAPLLPSWLSFNVTSGVLSGIPGNAEVGSHAVSLRVSDVTTDVDQDFTIVVANVNDVPTISGTPATLVAEDSVYSFTPTATDIDVGDTLTFSINNQPAWATFNTSTGLLSGIPGNADVGTTSGIVITVTDSALATASLPAFDLQVSNVNDAPVITSTAVTAATEDIAYSYTFTASDVDAGDVLTLSAPLLPSWLSFNTTSGELSGTPTNADVGSHGVSLRASDGTVNTDQNFSIIVTNVNSAPSISGTPGTTVAEDSAYSFTPIASDEDVGDNLTFSILNQPAWASFDSLTGQLSGTPGNGDVGITSGIIITVTDSALASASLPAFDLQVNNINDAPVITSSAVTAATEDIAYSYTFTASDVDAGDVLTYSAPILPGWLNFDTTSGVLSGTPTNAEVGSHAVTLRASDGTLNTDQSFIIVVGNVNDSPTITSTALSSATEDVPYTYTFTASDQDAGDVLTYSAPILPGWLNFNTTSAVLSGTPTNAEVGDHNVTLRVNDGTVNVEQSFTLTVTNVNDAPVISSTALTSAAENVTYSYLFEATDIDIGDVLVLSSPVLPAWLSFNTITGELSGTPGSTEIGSHSVTLRVSDGTVNVDQSFTIVVSNVNDAPTITSTPGTNATQDVAYTYTFAATDLDGGDVLTFSAPVLPGWLNFNAPSGLLSGTPGNADVGTHAVTLRVNDGTVDVDQGFTIIVINVNDAPTISGTPATVVAQGSAYSFTPTATDVDVGDTLSFSINNQPAWASFNASTGVLSGTPSNADVGITSGIIITVTDSALASASLPAFDLQVSNTNDAPVITSIAVTDATQDIAYSYTFIASDVDAGDVLILSAPVLPGWLNFNAPSGLLSGTPGNAEVGSHGVTLRVNDGTVDVDQDFIIVVTNVNDAPTITGSPATVVAQGSAYSFTPTATDIDVGDTLTFSISNQPAWASFNSLTGQLSGTPGNDDVGTTSGILITVTDSLLASTSLPAFDLQVSNINDAPSISSAPVTNAVQDELYSYTLSASDVDTDDVLTYSAPIIPGWLNFNTTSGVLSGTPTNAEVGEHGVTLRVNDGTVNVDQSFTLTVINVNDAPTITSTALTNALEDTPYSYTFTASDLDTTDLLTYSAPLLPGWLSFNVATGVLSGTPTNAEVGDHSITLRVNDGTVNVDQSFTLTVTNVNDAPTITSTALTTALEDLVYSYSFTANDLDAGDLLTYSAPLLPGWLSFNISTGVLSGTPTNSEVGSHSVTLRVSDGTVNVDQSFTITVSNVNDAPVITSTPLSNATQNAAYSYTFTASDADVGDVLTYSATLLPEWLSINATSGVLSGTPDNAAVGNNPVTLSVSDGSANVEQSFTITVTNVNDAPSISGIPGTLVAEGSPYNFTPTAIDVDTGDSLVFSIINAPTWAVFNPTTGSLTGTPGNSDVGVTNGIVITVTDNSLASASLPAFNLQVSNTNNAPSISGTPATSVDEDSSYSFTPVASDEDIGETLVFSINNAPSWVSFNPATGELSGIPVNNDVGVTNGIVITVTDGSSATASLPAFDLQVNNTNDAPVITSTAVTTAAEDTLYSYSFVVSDVDVADVLLLSAPLLPDWLSFNATSGVLSGTPGNADVGSHSVTLRASDGTLDVEQSFTIGVGNVNDAPVITSTVVSSATEDVVYTYAFTASDPDGADVLTYSAPILPAWLNFNDTTGVLSGTPGNDEVGSHAVTLRVNDGTVNVDQTFTLTVSNVNDAPTITSTAVTTAAEDIVYGYIFAVSDIDVADSLILSAPVLPGWLSFNSSTGVLTGTPVDTDVGSHNVTLRVSDGTVNVDQSFIISVGNINDIPVISGTPATRTLEGELYHFQPVASDADIADTLSFVISNQPGWASFDALTGTLSGTPTFANVGITSAVVIGVSDGSVTVNLPAFDLTVVGDLDGDGIGDDIDLDIDGDGMPNEFEESHGLDPLNPGDAALDADGDGRSNLEEFDDGTNPVLDEDPPVVNAPEDITLVSTGLYTQIKFAEVTAQDNVDGTLTAFNNVDDHLPPGSHEVAWSAVDMAGNIGFANQLINVIPLVEFAPDQLSAEGSTVSVKVMLNGPAVDSVEVPYTVSGTALSGEDHNLAVNGSISINSGTEAELSVMINNDELLESDETIIITMGTPLHAALGSRIVHTIKITENNIAPRVVLSAEQDQGKTRLVNKTAGSVSVFADIIDPDNVNHSYDWSGSDNALGVVDFSADTFVFDPLDLIPGLYHIRLSVSDGTDSGEAEIALNIVSTVPDLNSTDSDGDGIDDLTEGYGDSDNDGVPDYLDAIAQPNVLQAQLGSSAQNLMETESGLSLALGLVALQANPGQAAVSADDILNYTDSVKDEHENIGGLFDFVVSDLPIAGQSVRVVLPQSAPIPAKAVFRKLMPTGWQDFIEDSRNKLFSAVGEPAYCPPPGDLAYTPGLKEGAWCVQLLIEDGGPNDADGRANRRVHDPGGLAQQKNTVVNVKSSGGGAIHSLLLILMLWQLIWRLGFRFKGRISS